MRAFTIFAATMLISGVALADNTGTNGAGKNCFGQARSADASHQTNTLEFVYGAKNEGQVLSTRKGSNATDNEAFKDGCQPT